jgi:hypothetical protein
LAVLLPSTGKIDSEAADRERRERLHSEQLSIDRPVADRTLQARIGQGWQSWHRWGGWMERRKSQIYQKHCGYPA